MVILTMSTGTGIRELHKRVFDKYRHRHSTGTGMGLPYEQQQAFVRAFSGNFTMTHTVYTTSLVSIYSLGNAHAIE